ncbi:MAG TPA: DUF6445 family protein [Povalibacter sp.]|nr:DUF6445 family protein [Povalibacter sp.]
MEFRIDHIGNARAAVIVIENAWPDPQALIDFAAARNDYSARSLYYPGVRSAAPADYVRWVATGLQELVRTTFELDEEVVVSEANFSLVTLSSERLVPFQRVPHFDSTDRKRIAVLHYLCKPEHGGTSFYRHRSTGIEIMTEEMREQYMRTVNAEVRSQGMPPSRFIDESTNLFERVAKYEAVFNRMLIYAGSFLHSGNVPPNVAPDANPRTGRLTLNTFLRPRSASAQYWAS